MATHGVKHDQEKPDMDLLSPIALEKIAQVMTFGKKKYGANNWRGGIAFSRLLAAVMRHINAYRKGESIDPETGLSHLAHASCGLMMLLEFEETTPDLDDRYFKENAIDPDVKRGNELREQIALNIGKIYEKTNPNDTHLFGISIEDYTKGAPKAIKISDAFKSSEENDNQS